MYGFTSFFFNFAEYIEHKKIMKVMKKILILAFLASIANIANAQGTWEIPSNSNQDERPRRALIDTQKTIDPKYLEGNVPEENGKVCWSYKISMPGKDGSSIYDKMLEVMQTFIRGEKQTKLSNIAVVNKSNKQIGARMQEILVFSNKVLSLDQTIMNYHLLLDCHDGECVVRMTNISYNYEPDRPTAAIYTAEEMIADKVALNKKKTGFTKGGSKKFRMKTIDRKDEIFAELEALSKK